MEEHSGRKTDGNYIGTASRSRIDIDAGPEIRCPKCKKILMEGTLDQIQIRCKHCRHWVYVCKKSIDKCEKSDLKLVN